MTGALLDQLPIGVVFGFGQGHALAGNDFRGLRLARLQRLFHRLNQRMADKAYHLTARGHLLRIDRELLAGLGNDGHVTACLR
jgi:hypothetical protein